MTNKRAIIGVLNNPPTSMNSHSAGMVNIVAKLFNADVVTNEMDWKYYDELIIYHGVNFRPGSYNIIGGLGEEVLKRAEKLSTQQNKIYTLDGFQLNDFSIKRKLLKYDDFPLYEKIELPSRKNLVIGDSHSISVWTDDSYTIQRNDGKTLHGFLKEGKDLSQYEKITMYFGNIDIRFHLSRMQDPVKSTIDLFTRYCEYASKYDSTIVELLPIENESRIIPKSGMYKGKPYYGTIKERQELRRIANKVMYDSGINMITWPKHFCNDQGELNFEIMEPKKSVHIRPIYYHKENMKQLELKLF